MLNKLSRIRRACSSIAQKIVHFYKPLAIAAGTVFCSMFSLAQPPNFITFESGHVRPFAISADGTTLFACNTPDNRLEVFSITDEGLLPLHSIPVGLEPVSVAVNDQNEAWVVNHLSDSLSIIDLSSATPRVARALLASDEPRDIVFAANGRVFITTAHRGQHRSDLSIANVPRAGDPQLTTPRVPRADVWVFGARSHLHLCTLWQRYAHRIGSGPRWHA